MLFRSLVVYHFYCGETAADGKEEPRAALARYLNSVIESNAEPAYSDQYSAYKGLQKGFKAMSYESYMYPERVIFGDPDQCAERIRQIQSLGVTNISLLANFGGLGHDQVLASLDRFAQHVMPRFH